MKNESSAGGVIVRKRGRGWQVLVICDMADNWTFPKGTIEMGETAQQAARREINEEVGLSQIRHLVTLPTINYIYERNGKIKKTVQYFLYRHVGQEKPVRQKEEGIRAVSWWGLREAVKRIGYPETNAMLLMRALKHL